MSEGWEASARFAESSAIFIPKTEYKRVYRDESGGITSASALALLQRQHSERIS